LTNSNDEEDIKLTDRPPSTRGIANRREILAGLAAVGLGTPVFQRALAAQAEKAGELSIEMIQQAEWIAGVSFDPDERAEMLKGIQGQQDKLAKLRSMPVAYSTPSALLFNPTPGQLHEGEVERGAARTIKSEDTTRPSSAEDLAFLPVNKLASLVRTKQVSSVELTKLYLERLHSYNPALNCVVTFLDDLALEQAQKADTEIASGNYRGPLHGIPWGAKDLISYPGYKTTWGATPFENQVLDTKATVAARLEEAGAVLLAKLSLGALAWGDGWFRGQTRNPWNPSGGSSGSSAGSASATAAGLAAFTLGSETLGSIISPCRVCGCTGLRPTFGRVSRYGCMSLAWSMDKIGPITRSIEDCALILDAIHGADGLDPTAVDRSFAWPSPQAVKSMRVGYFESKEKPMDQRSELTVLRDLGATLIPIELPSDISAGPLTIILDTESTAVFDELVRQKRLEGTGLWPNSFRRGQLIPAVEYLRANRLRMRLMEQMAELMKTVDAYVGGNDLTITNLTGHPTVILPHAANTKDERSTPQTITFTGRLYGESTLLALAHAYEQAVGFNGRPDIAALKKLAEATPTQ
jgi:Asp-tRNA(Asn)/Glu-tRNA(Gln) amidotransferase A subunit family amidase